MLIWFVGAANLLVGRVQNIEPPFGTEKLYQNAFGCPSVRILTPALLGVPYFWEFSLNDQVLRKDWTYGHGPTPTHRHGGGDSPVIWGYCV